MSQEPDFSKGPIVAVAQDADSGRVLMVAYMDEEAWRRTLETGRAWFRSRSRGLWEKGATSGSYLDLVEATLDCDRDAVLLLVRPRGPVCHTGATGCFDVGPPAGGRVDTPEPPGATEQMAGPPSPS